MNKYNFQWTGQYLTIDDTNGKRIGFKCVSKKKARFLKQLVIDANLGAMAHQGSQADHSPDEDDMGNATFEECEA